MSDTNKNDNILHNDNSSESDYAADLDSPSISESGKISFAVAKSEGGVSSLFDFIRCLLFSISVVVICLTFVFRLVSVDGTSMENTLSSQDKVIATNLFYTPKDDDIVVISHGAQYKEPIIKRVIATAGQTIKLDYENNQVIVDGVVRDEPFIKEDTFCGNYAQYDIPEVVPEGKIFVMGDNRKVSMDSRSEKIGLIDVDDVIGKAQFVIWPFSHFGYLY